MRGGMLVINGDGVVREGGAGMVLAGRRVSEGARYRRRTCSRSCSYLLKILEILYNILISFVIYF